jgi:hypothetical protein
VVSGDVFTIYAGEDLADDTAITAAQENGIAAVVGPSRRR